MTEKTNAQRLADIVGGHCAAELRRLEAANAELVDALKDTLDFCEHHSNRWDGARGKHIFSVVEAARAAIRASMTDATAQPQPARPTPAARLMYRKKDLKWCSSTAARTFEECGRDAYPSEWEEGPLLYTGAELERQASGALAVLAAMDGGEWSIKRNPHCESLTDEANARHAWSAQREKAPYCTRDGHRIFTGPTAIAALQAGMAAFKDD